jgi:hypothetical protein
MNEIKLKMKVYDQKCLSNLDLDPRDPFLHKNYQHTSRFMLIFMKSLEMYLKVKNCEVNKIINYILQSALTIHPPPSPPKNIPNICPHMQK